MLVNFFALKYLEIHTSYISCHIYTYRFFYIYARALLPKRNRKTPAVYASCRMGLASNGSSLSQLGPNWQQHRRSASRCLRDTASSVVEHVWSPRYFAVNRPSLMSFPAAFLSNPGTHVVYCPVKLCCQLTRGAAAALLPIAMLQ
jgi:hypothetical protein